MSVLVSRKTYKHALQPLINAYDNDCPCILCTQPTFDSVLIVCMMSSTVGILSHESKGLCLRPLQERKRESPKVTLILHTL